MPESSAEILEALLDRHAIVDLTIRYATALDGRDWKQLAGCFLPDAIADYGRAVGVLQGIDAITAACRSVLEPLDASQHLVTNHEVELSGDTAGCHCYFMAQHTRRGCEGGDNYTLGGSYRDELVRKPEGWRIRRRALEVAWQEGNPRVLAGGD